MGWKICGSGAFFADNRLNNLMKKILVTGASGFIGNYVIAELLKDKNCIIIASSSSLEKAKKSDWFSSVQYIPFNLNEFDSNVNYYQYFNQPDALIHLAWEGLPNYKSAIHLTKNLPLQKKFLKNLIEHGLRDITVTGTCFEYGMKEGCLSEDIECEPTNAYAIAKHELRQALEKLTAQYECSFKWIRLFYMYGKGQSSKSLISQLDQAIENGHAVFNMSGGEQVRDFLRVEEVAENIVAIAAQKEVAGIVNCCSGKPVTVKEFVLEYVAAQHKSIQLNLGYYPYADYEAMRFWGDDEKLKSILKNNL